MRASTAVAGASLLLALAVWWTASPADPEIARDLIAQGRCHCGCGRSLPNSPGRPACFGCSVGKAEITYILESLAAGRSANQILLDLQEPVLVEVFADYTDPELPETWQRARRAADEAHQHRVVLRTPGLSAEGRRALELAECGRERGQFSQLQAALIEHRAPWDDATLLELAGQAGLSPGALRACLERIDVEAQLAKDREHVSLRNIEAFPALCVNRKLVPNTGSALRAAIRRALLEGSI